MVEIFNRYDEYYGSLHSGLAYYGSIYGDHRMIHAIYEDIQQVFSLLKSEDNETDK